MAMDRIHSCANGHLHCEHCYEISFNSNDIDECRICKVNSFIYLGRFYGIPLDIVVARCINQCKYSSFTDINEVIEKQSSTDEDSDGSVEYSR